MEEQTVQERCADFNKAIKEELYLNEEKVVYDGIHEVGQMLFVKLWDYQAYTTNPITPSGWVTIKKAISDKDFLHNLGRYKEKKSVFEIVYYFAIDLIKKYSS